MVKKDQLCAIALMKRLKINCEGFTLNGYYGNQPYRFQVMFYSININTSWSLTKQDLTFKQAYCVSFCVVLNPSFRI